MAYWWRLLLQVVLSAASLARLKAGRSKAARMAMTAITTNSSMRVNAEPPSKSPLTSGFRPDFNCCRSVSIFITPAVQTIETDLQLALRQGEHRG